MKTRMIFPTWKPSGSDPVGKLVDIDPNNKGDLIGYTAIAPAGATNERPGSPRIGDLFIDTSLSAVVVFTGADWKNVVTGVAT